MARFFLRKDKLETFKTWCGRNGIPTRRPLGKYEVLQVALRHMPGWAAIHTSNKKTPNYTVDKRIVPVVMRFYSETDDEDFFSASQCALDDELKSILKSIKAEGPLPSREDQLMMAKKPRRVITPKPSKVIDENGPQADSGHFNPKLGHPSYTRTA